MLRSYLPAVVFVLIGVGLGGLFAFANARLGPRVPRRDRGAYESGLPSDVRPGFRFGISFYLVAILFIIFDIEVILLFPVSLQLEAYGFHALGAVGLFLLLLVVAFVYEWRRGSLEWRDSGDVESSPPSPHETSSGEAEPEPGRAPAFRPERRAGARAT